MVSRLFGSATDRVEFRLSPNDTLTAAYTQNAPKGAAFRNACINKTPVKQK